jgi:hypothetical protein
MSLKLTLCDNKLKYFSEMDSQYGCTRLKTKLSVSIYGLKDEWWEIIFHLFV